MSFSNQPFRFHQTSDNLLRYPNFLSLQQHLEPSVTVPSMVCFKQFSIFL